METRVAFVPLPWAVATRLRRRSAPRTGGPPVRFFLTLALAWAVRATTLAGPPTIPDADEEQTVLPPWAITAPADPQMLAARTDAFASTLGATSVVTEATWRDRSVITLADALRRAPGVVLQESFGGFEPPRLSLRGSGLDSAPTSRGVALLVEGLPLARADGAWHSGLLDPTLFSRIEIFRGTLHAALTPAVLGGVLNASAAPAPVPTPAQLQIETGSGAAGRARFTTETRRAATGLRLAGSLAHQEGARARSRQTRAALTGALQHRLSPSAVLTATVYWAQADYEVPGPLTLADAFAAPRSISAAVARDQPRREAGVIHAAAQLQMALADATFSAGLAAQHGHDDFRQLQANGETDSRSDDLSGQLTYARRGTVAGCEHRLLVRGSGAAGDHRQQRYLNHRGARGTRFADLALRSATGALSLEDLVGLRPDLTLGGGLTAVLEERRLAARTPLPGFAGPQRYHSCSPRAGLTWQATPEVSLSTAISHGMEPPTFDDLLTVAGTYPELTLRGRELRSQRATTVEVGARGAHGPWQWNVTIYRSHWTGEILHLADAEGQPRGAVNAATTLHQGIEAALRCRLLDRAHRLTLSATGTWSAFHFADDPVYGDQRLAGAPPHCGSAELLYEHPRGGLAAVEAVWTAGRTPVDYANLLGYGGSTLWNLRVGWHCTARLTVLATVRNLLDRAHIASTAGVLDRARNPAATALFLPGNGRQWTLRLDWVY